MLKILVITQYFWPENFHINDLVLGLYERGHKIDILTGIPNYPKGVFYKGYTAINKCKDVYKGMTVYRSPLIPRGRNGAQLVLNYISFALISSIIGPFLCRKRRYDIYFVYEPSPITVGITALVFKHLKKAPIVIWIQDLWPESLSAAGAISSKGVLKSVELLVRLIYKGCDHILAQSKAFIPSIVNLAGRAKKIFYYPNSADSLYQPVSVPTDAVERLLFPVGFRIVFAGNIGAAQDFGTILSAAEKLKYRKDIHWIIIGDGRLSKWVQTEIIHRGLLDNVHLLGRHPAEAMPRFFALSDVLLTTLKKEPIFALTIPSKIQSYLACAKPIIAGMDGEGARVVEEAGAGITCPAEDPTALALAVLEMYQMTQKKRDEMGRSGREYYEKNFEREKLIDRLTELMELSIKEVY